MSPCSAGIKMLSLEPPGFNSLALFIIVLHSCSVSSSARLPFESIISYVLSLFRITEKVVQPVFELKAPVDFASREPKLYNFIASFLNESFAFINPN